MVSRLQCGRSSRLISHSADYLHLTKRFGIVAASQLPFHYLLIWKSSWSPIQTLTRTTHETLNVYHQALGRIVTLLVFLHAAFYLNFYVQNNILGNKLKEAYVLCGIAGTIAFAAIGTTALSPVRRWSYRIFYAVHVILSIALLPVLFFHVHHLRIYLYETAAVYALNSFVRWLSVSNRSGTIRSIPNTSLVEISIQVCDVKGQRLFTNYRPGQHAYVSLARNPLSRQFNSNPLTAVSIPSTDKHLKFVARALDGNTRKLAMLAEKTSYGVDVGLSIEGPHGLSNLEDKLLQFDRVLFVAGGVGATFILPLYRQLLADLSPGKGSYRRQKVTFVWIARSESEVTWAVPTDQREKEGFVERLKICITGASSAATAEIEIDYNDGVTAAAVDDGNDGIELEEQKQLLADNSEPIAAPKDLPIYTGRPDLRRLVHQALSHGSNERVAIITCGPKSLSQNLRREIAPWVIKRGRDVWYHDESFSL
jgi:ferredoxin-NADP reductase